MSDDKTKDQAAAQAVAAAEAAKASKSQSKELTAADAAKRVKRGKVEDGAPAKVARTKDVSVAAAEVLAFRDYGTHVVVVTKDGQKLSSADE